MFYSRIYSIPKNNSNKLVLLGYEQDRKKKLLLLILEDYIRI